MQCSVLKVVLTLEDNSGWKEPQSNLQLKAEWALRSTFTTDVAIEALLFALGD